MYNRLHKFRQRRKEIPSLRTVCISWHGHIYPRIHFGLHCMYCWERDMLCMSINQINGIQHIVQSSYIHDVVNLLWWREESSATSDVGLFWDWHMYKLGFLQQVAGPGTDVRATSAHIRESTTAELPSKQTNYTTFHTICLYSAIIRARVFTDFISALQNRMLAAAVIMYTDIYRYNLKAGNYKIMSSIMKHRSPFSLCHHVCSRTFSLCCSLDSF